MAASKVEENRGRFRKGRPKTGGRKRGSPNKVTREVKAFLAEVLKKPAVQDALEEKLVKGDTTAFFKGLHGQSMPQEQRR